MKSNMPFSVPNFQWLINYDFDRLFDRPIIDNYFSRYCIAMSLQRKQRVIYTTPIKVCLLAKTIVINN